jgi:hypothetical protein
MKHCIIENEESYFYARRKIFKADKVIWHTTSPWLLEKLPTLGEEVCSLEKNVTVDIQNKLTKIIISVARDIAKYVNENNLTLKEDILLGNAFERNIQQILYVTLYKLLLLEQFYLSFNNGSNVLSVVGDCSLTKTDTLMLNYDRFDTLFTVFAKAMIGDDIEIIPYRASNEVVVLQKMSSFGAKFIDKVIYYANFNLSRIISAKLRLKKARIPLIWKNANRTVFFLKPTELLSDTFIPLLLNGVKVINRSLNFPKIEAGSFGTNYGQFLKYSNEALQKAFLKHEFDYDASFIKSFDVFFKRLFTKLNYVDSILNCLPESFAWFQKSSSSDFAIATNGLTTVEQRIWQQYFVNKGIPVFFFQHGVTAGVDATVSWLHKWETEDNDIKFCYSEAAFNAYTDFRQKPNALVAGAPHANKKIQFRNIQKYILRRRFKIKKSERLVLYLTLIARNNMVYGPGESDLEYYSITKSIAKDVLSSIEDRCIIKLYPASRYLDPDPTEIMSLADNIEICQYIDFSILRSIPDVIVLHYAQSAFGWAWSARVPIIFIEFPSMPLHDETRKLFEQSIFLINGSEKNWVDQVKGLLLLPHSELMKQWNAKESVRRKVEESHIFGPKGNSGKRCSDFILRVFHEQLHPKKTA